MPLKYREPTKATYVNVLLYGPPKTGKTAGAFSAPGFGLAINADLPNATWFAHEMHNTDDRIAEVNLIEGLQTLTDVHQLVHATERPDFITVDPVGELHRRLLEAQSNRAIRPTLPQYGDTSTYLERFFRMLCEAPLNTIFVAHEHPVKDEATGTFERLPWTGTTNPALGQKLLGMVDIVGYTAVMPSEGVEPIRYVSQLVRTPGRAGGDRFGVLGDWRITDLADWFDAVGCHRVGNMPITAYDAEGAPA